MLAKDDIDQKHLQIERYDKSGVVTVNGVDWRESVLITPTEVIPWAAKSIEDLTPSLLEPILKLQPDLVIIGTGERSNLMSAKLMLLFQQHHIGLECMNNASACRTHMAVLAEERDVVTALIL